MKLSICIATYNRAAFIGETLDHLARQLTEDVELVVVDGGSTDGTEQVMAQFVSRHPRTIYRREAVNSGVDQDFDKAVEFACGEYCWLMSDDDLVLPGAVSRVLSGLGSGPDLLVVNAEVWSRGLNVRLKKSQLPATFDRDYGSNEQDQLLADAGSYLSFIGGVVVSRAAWLARERRPYYGSMFIHVGVLFQRPLLGRASVIAQPLIRIRYGNASWSARSFDIWVRKWPGVVWSFVHLPDAAKAQVTPHRPATKARTLLWYRALGVYGRQECRSLRNEPHHRLAGAIARLPMRLANAAVAAYVYVRGDENCRIMIYDLARATCASATARWAASRLGIADGRV